MPSAFIQFKEWLYLQAYTFEAKELAFQVSTQLNLDFSPRSLRRYEKTLD
ncbi:hypothetical protein LZ575_12700 [Antarcticibacterium sp. 1MA-6-2]|nr:hypothetical protein [Antarcticibacterium sp. 1MA-6-2]UJH89859.1 hypothetical protein LZ575_12700 [Antarcticibacterium sp. 1MA-6-2]